MFTCAGGTFSKTSFCARPTRSGNMQCGELCQSDRANRTSIMHAVFAWRVKGHIISLVQNVKTTSAAATCNGNAVMLENNSLPMR